jgi:hypothetical protein
VDFLPQAALAPAKKRKNWEETVPQGGKSWGNNRHGQPERKM